MCIYVYSVMGDYLNFSRWKPLSMSKLSFKFCHGYSNIIRLKICHTYYSSFLPAYKMFMFSNFIGQLIHFLYIKFI